MRGSPDGSWLDTLSAGRHTAVLPLCVFCSVMIFASPTKFLASLLISPWFRRLCIVAACLMAVIVLVGAQGVGKVNHVPHWFHKVEHFFYFGTMAALLAHGLGRRWYWLALVAV